MRVTNAIMRRDSVLRLQTNLQAIERAQRQISSGLKVERMSDDPTAANEVVRLSSSLRVIDQFRRNLNQASGRAQTAESVLDRLTSTLGRGVELAIGQGGSTATTQTRLAAKAEVDQLITLAVDIGNTRFGDTYLFAGTRGTEAPFAVPGSPTDPFTALRDQNGDPVDPTGNPRFEIGDGVFTVAGPNGTEAFLDTGALEALRSLSTALGNDDMAGIQSAQVALQQSVSRVQTVIGGIGARTNAMETAGDQLDALEFTLTRFRSDLRDVEVEEAISELSGRQTAYQAALAATSRILGTSLADYLR